MIRKTLGTLFFQTLNDVLNVERKTRATLPETERKLPDCKLNLASSRAHPMPNHFPCQDRLAAFKEDDAERIVEALGPMPREVLTAMFDYGLDDVEIGRYFRLSTNTVTMLRRFYGIAHDREIG